MDWLIDYWRTFWANRQKKKIHKFKQDETVLF